MTCFVPTPLMRDHMHFIDGASGGYAMAAMALRDKLHAAVSSALDAQLASPSTL